MSITDPMEKVTVRTVTHPPFQGRGSGREAWIDYAIRMTEANSDLFELVDQQSRAIEKLNAELELLRRQIATRKPPGGRAPTPDRVVERIESEIDAGGSDRGIAVRYGVSHMTVHRTRKRMQARQQIKAAACSR